MTNLYFGDIPHVNRHAILLAQHDCPQIIEITDQADATNQILLRVLRQYTTAGIGVIASDCLIDIGDAQAKMAQTIRVDQHLILLGKAALRIDFSDTRNRAQQRSHHPVLGGPALHQFFLGQRPVSIVRPLQGVLINLAQTARNRPKHRRNARRQTRTNFQQTLHDQLTGEVKIRLVIEHQRDQRQTRFVQRAHFLQTGQAGHRHFQRHGGKTLNFFR